MYEQGKESQVAAQMTEKNVLWQLKGGVGGRYFFKHRQSLEQARGQRSRKEK